MRPVRDSCGSIDRLEVVHLFVRTAASTAPNGALRETLRLHHEKSVSRVVVSAVNLTFTWETAGMAVRPARGICAKRQVSLTYYGDVRTEVVASENVLLEPVDLIHREVLDDTALMREVATGSVEAFSILVERHSAALYRVAMRMLSDSAEAEDVTQDCFTRLWQNAPHWQPSGAGLVGWLHRVTMNLCFDRKRKFRVVTVEELPDPADDAPLADRVIEADQAAQAISAALADLPERHRAALVLCYYEGFSNALVAQMLDLNIKAMESLLFRARRQMRGLLEARNFSCADLAEYA